MKRAPVSSSNLSSVGYDESNQVLEIEFHVKESTSISMSPNESTRNS